MQMFPVDGSTSIAVQERRVKRFYHRVRIAQLCKLRVPERVGVGSVGMWTCDGREIRSDRLSAEGEAVVSADGLALCL